jgi:hypothetical protein
MASSGPIRQEDIFLTAFELAELEHSPQLAAGSFIRDGADEPTGGKI